MTTNTRIDRDARILILGAGPGGLSAAHYLRQYGFKNVTVFEKLGRVGGMCRSITEDNQAFDLGAVFVSSSYREVLRLARSVGAKLERFDGATAIQWDQQTGTAHFGGLLHYVLGGSSLWSYLRLCLRYLWTRFRVRKLVQQTGWAGISQHPELCVNFAEWLERNGLSELSRLFGLPVTTFGYGSLDEIPAPYVLKYMELRTFLAVILTAAPFAWLLPSRLVARRFHFGFQRLWDRLAWDLNVRLNVDVKQIRRSERGVDVTYMRAMQVLGDAVPHAEDQAHFDYLMIACPLMQVDLEQFLDLTEQERWFQSQTRYIPYAVASFEIANLTLPRRVVFPVPTPAAGHPMLVGQAHPNNALMTFYARLANPIPTEQDEAQLRDSIVRLVGALGGHIDPQDDWRSFDAWLYFKHTTADQFREGYFDRWEEAQGQNRTFFVGGLFDFDFVEGVVRYSRRIVEQHFVGMV
jgi:monoamine oxidase